MSKTARCLAVIPSRFPSTRLPGKPLKDIGGKTLVQRVWEQSKKSKLISRVIIASDDERILSVAKNFGAEVMLTSSEHETGTDRVAEVAARLADQGEQFDLISNVQGDLPFINPTVIDQTIQALASAEVQFGMSTVGTPITDESEYLRPATVKIALGAGQRALYFSRAPIPFWRDRTGTETVTEQEPFALKHMGLYVFRPDTLQKISKFERVFVEKREALEQLRALANGVQIKVAIVSRELLEPSIEIDTPEDLARAIKYVSGQSAS